MALFLPAFNHNFFEPLDVFQPRGSFRRLFPQPRCQSLLPVAELMAPLTLWTKLNDDDFRKENDQFLADLNLSGFDPAQVKVSVDKSTRMVTVKGEKEEKDEKANVVSFRHYERSFPLPEECSLDQITSKWNPEGNKLTLMAPRQESGSPEALKHTPDQVNDEPIEIPVANADFEFSIDLSGFNPEDMEVLVDKDGVVNILAKREEKMDNGTVSTKEVKKRIPIDASKFNLNEISSSLTDNGILSIKAPIKKTPAKRSVPIVRV